MATAEYQKHTFLLFPVLIAAGLAGNYFNFPIFLNIDFLFGSIFAMLALQLFGLGRGILAGIIISLYTYFLWNHPYAIVVMSAEVAVVGWAITRRRIEMVLADTLFWICIGMPLVYVFYHLVMHVPINSCSITMIKQAMNGIANTLLARTIFICYTLYRRTSHISYREIIYNLLALFVLCPTLFILAVSSRTDFRDTDRHLRETLIQDSIRLNDRVGTWMLNRKSAVTNLATMAATRSPAQMQPFLEQARNADISYLRIGLADSEATAVAFSPLVDENGKSTIGVNFADRPYVPTLKETLKPMFSEVIVGKVGIIKPRVLILAPVVVSKKFSGYVFGVLDLGQIKEHFIKSTVENGTLYTLLDQNGNVILSNRTDQTVMKPLSRGAGEIKPLGSNIKQWTPELPANSPLSERWSKSYYIAETAVGDRAEWRLILEQPVAPFQKILFRNYSSKLIELFLILLGTLVLAELLSRRIAVSLGKLSTLTRDLPSRLIEHSEDIEWPESGIQEIDHLIENFMGMSVTLDDQLLKIRQMNESLEQRVKERTRQVELLAHEQQVILSTMPIGACFINNRTVKSANPAFDAILGYETGETLGMSTSAFYATEESYELVGKEGYAELAKGGSHTVDLEMKRKDGSLVWCCMIGQAVDTTAPETGTIWMLQDITERINNERTIREMAFHDPLTGLANRRLFEDRLEQTIVKSHRYAMKFGLFNLDLDHFKDINDTYGHNYGDQVLQEAATRIRACCKRELDTIGRKGGDEFGIIVTDCGDREQLATIAELLLEQFSRPFVLGGLRLKVTISIGVSMFPDDSTGMYDLDIASDKAMYAAKKSGRNTYRFAS